MELEYKITKDIYLDFYLANSKEKVEDLLVNKYNLKNYDEKIKLLEQIMGVKKSFNLEPSNINDINRDELEYNIRLAKFLEGSWKTI
ncbi:MULTISPECIES: hypothetical protein [Brachyspira]|uniref:Uncharacterized protein n=1 Tax=Brachyspira catarrhinii TaxID=2528966 RepID=A0ABY2TNT7_9SPIR|nr:MULTISPECIES: hypothetical protein [Brachyspira]PTY39241.1 hypothetical protein DQ06_00980 [Brachyspira hampsonii bv. II]TKZ26658.1 hypothetical protein EZH24_12190 [Brachyspira catarrhinii]